MCLVNAVIISFIVIPLTDSVQSTWKQRLRGIRRSKISSSVSTDVLQLYDVLARVEREASIHRIDNQGASWNGSSNHSLLWITQTRENMSENILTVKARFNQSSLLWSTQADELSEIEEYQADSSSTGSTRRAPLIIMIICTCFALIVHLIWLRAAIIRINSSRVCNNSHLTLCNHCTHSSDFVVTFTLPKWINYRLQLHLALIGILYAATLLFGKTWMYLYLRSRGLDISATFPTQTEHITGASLYKFCGGTKAISLVFHTVYWVNMIFLCHTQIKHVAFSERQPKCATGRTHRSRKYFTLFFYLSTSWIYSILLRLGSFIFANFPEPMPRKTHSTNALFLNVQVLAIDCKLYEFTEDAPNVKSICEFSLAEIILEFAVSILGDTFPIFVLFVVIVQTFSFRYRRSRFRNFNTVADNQDTRNSVSAFSCQSATVWTNVPFLKKGAFDSIPMSQRLKMQFPSLLCKRTTWMLLATSLALINHTIRLVHHIRFVNLRRQMCADKWRVVKQNVLSSARFTIQHVVEIIEVLCIAIVPIWMLLPWKRKSPQGDFGSKTVRKSISELTNAVSRENISLAEGRNIEVEISAEQIASSTHVSTDVSKASASLSIPSVDSQYSCKFVSEATCSSIHYDLTRYVGSDSSAKEPKHVCSLSPISVHLISLPTLCCQTYECEPRQNNNMSHPEAFQLTDLLVEKLCIAHQEEASPELYVVSN